MKKQKVSFFRNEFLDQYSISLGEKFLLNLYKFNLTLHIREISQ